MLRIKRTGTILIFFIITMACSLLNPTPEAAPPNGSVPGGEIVVWHINLMMDKNIPVNINGTVLLYSATVPLSIKISYQQMTAETSNGRVIRYIPVSAPKKVEYQLCYSTGGFCELQGLQWKSDNDVVIADINLDWSKIKELSFRLRFRDVSQKPLLSLSWDNANYHVGNAPTDVSEISFPVDFAGQSQPGPTTTTTPPPPLSITETYAATMAPVQGSIVIAPETSVIGGTAGSTHQVPVFFTAASILGKITEMRVNDGEWEAFVPQKDYPIYIQLNWSTVHFCVEYRDEKGNTSPRYCASKATEGSPHAQ